jgi:hypothetical protein
MRFDIMRESSIRDGLVGLDAPRPVPAAVADRLENRWVVEINTLDELIDLSTNEGSLEVLAVHPEDGGSDLHILAIQD